MNTEKPLFTWFGPWGLPVQVMPSTAFLLLLFVGLSASSVDSIVWGLNMFAILVTAIFLHEVGHAWGAHVQGIKVHRIVIHGGGGFCEHRSAGARASELIVLMGPLVNLGLWAVLSLGAWAILPTFPSYDASEEVWEAFFRIHDTRFEVIYWLDTAAQINLMLFVLNMIPVQPLDGGKLLHLWLLRVLRPDVALMVVGGFGVLCTLLWIPAMIALYFYVGFVLLFFPSLRMHWSMLRGGTRLRRLDRR
ncbi:site-2 protease family protein [uncultured Tateyamaria sp.]|uniref:metalloprotease n=1 Tax=Tateyamaria sp. 1078 TaxID=3417464 RepID=UPI00343E5007